MTRSGEQGIPSTTSFPDQHLRVMHHLSYDPTLRPWILGNFAIYAPSIHVAREVYDLIRQEAPEKLRGTARIDDGTAVSWVNISRPLE
jgi:hypothetical protein